MSVMRPGSTTTSRVQVLDSASTVIIAGANRLGFSIYNDTGQTLYVRLSSEAAASTTKSFVMLSGAYYESPILINYCGPVTARMAAGTSGYVDVTEFLA